MGCTTETEIANGFIADILAITKTRHVYEVEIKTSKADLQTELKAINQALSNKDIPRREWAPKYGKHALHIHGKSVYGWEGSATQQTISANRFYFAVPEELREMAIGGVRDTPYGIILLGKRYVREVLKRAKLLHNNKMSEDRIFKIIHRLSLENMGYMNKLTTIEENLWLKRL